MVEYKLACKNNIKDLKILFKDSFHVSSLEIDYFFKNIFKLENCPVCLVDGNLVAALHMIDTYILKNSKKYPVYYLYAAATFLKYRGNGYMRGLINYANDLAFKRGQLYSVLLPGNSSLYNFYEKLGYRKFFKIKLVELTDFELKSFIFKNFKKGENYAKTFESLRNNFFNNDGDIFWNQDHINYAINESRTYGGDIVFCEDGYAICNVDENCIEVIEIVFNGASFNNLLNKIYNSFKKEKYIFRLRANENYFCNKGIVKDFGMIKSLDKCDRLKFFNKEKYKFPYLGLTLD